MTDYTFYDKHKYSLKTFHYTAIPNSIREVIIQLHQQYKLVIRGGLAYIIASGDNSYLLRDIDLAIEQKHKAALLTIMSSLCDEMYLNKNTFGNDVVTLFWKSGEEYYKLDILLVEMLPTAYMVYLEIFDRQMRIMDLTNLYYNRICKIAEKELRKYSDEKVMRHFHVVTELNRYFMGNGVLNYETVKKIGINNWSEKMQMSMIVIAPYLNDGKWTVYCTNLNAILEKMKGE